RFDLGTRFVRRWRENADQRHFGGLLRACGRDERASDRAAKQDDELPSPHSITSSASASSARGTVIPSSLSVLKLISSSILGGCSMGISAGLAPFRILSTYPAAWRQFSFGLGPYLIKPPSCAKPSSPAMMGSRSFSPRSAIDFRMRKNSAA